MWQSLPSWIFWLRNPANCLALEVYVGNVLAAMSLIFTVVVEWPESLNAFQPSILISGYISGYVSVFMQQLLGQMES